MHGNWHANRPTCSSDGETAESGGRGVVSMTFKLCRSAKRRESRFM
jgi:hypothetical protein